jgi:hypothetical protein
MWIFTPIGFYSAVKNNQVPGHVLVRCRAKEDAWNLYRQYSTDGRYAKGRQRWVRVPMSQPKADEKRDYRWRLSMKRSDWAKVVKSLATRIEYTNFKDEVHKHADQDNKNSAYLSIWSAMLRVQHGEDSPKTGQRYFGEWKTDWQREIEFANEQYDRFDEPAVPTKTIKSVTLGNHDK